VICCRFVGGELNTCYNAVDRHVARGFGEQVAIIHDSPVTDSITKITYGDLQKQVDRSSSNPSAEIHKRCSSVRTPRFSRQSPRALFM
ncbi:hypothetical protein LSAT2_012200, partial [Lamellibrachia satsuma]